MNGDFGCEEFDQVQIILCEGDVSVSIDGMSFVQHLKNCNHVCLMSQWVRFLHGNGQNVFRLEILGLFAQPESFCFG